MVKKIMSSFMACVLLASSLSAPIFAGGDMTFPVQYPKKGKTQKTSVFGASESSLQRKRKTVQKAFLTALLLAQDVEVEIKLSQSRLKTLYDCFQITKIQDSIICTKEKYSNNFQINILLDNLSAINGISFDNAAKGVLISCAKINGHILTQNTICEIGEKILKLIEEKRQYIISNHLCYKDINLKEDSLFMQKISNIFGDLLDKSSSKDENTLSFFEIASSSKKLEPVTNHVHVKHLKKHPETSSLLIACYEQTFFASLISAFGTEVAVKPQSETAYENFPRCFFILKLGNQPIYTKDAHCAFLTNMIKLINSIFPPEKLKIETVPMSYSVPTKVTINNEVVLNENDVINLGQRFYNLIYKMISENALTLYKINRVIHLDGNIGFTQNVKRIFKEYTGKNLTI